MRAIFAIAGVLTLTIGNAFAETPGNDVNTTDDLALVPGFGIGRADSETVRANAPTAVYDSNYRNGFKTEIERYEFSAVFPGLSGTPAGGVRSTTLMLNGLYEFRNGGWRIKPYVGFGIGTTDFSARLLGISDNTFIPTFQVKGGVNYSITQKLLGKLEYRWSQGNAPSLGIAGVPAKFQLKRGGFLVGLNYRLN